MKPFKSLSKSLARTSLIKITEEARYDLYHLEVSLCPKIYKPHGSL